MIGKYAVAMYGAKTNSTELPVNAQWTIFSGLEPAPDIAFTKLEADRIRAGHFRDRVLKKNSSVQKKSFVAVRQENDFDNDVPLRRHFRIFSSCTLRHDSGTRTIRIKHDTPKLRHFNTRSR